MSKSLEVVYENNLLVVDGNNIAYRWKHSGTRHFFKEYLATIQSFKKSYKARHVIVLADGGKSFYRKALYPEYKGDREEKFKNQTEIEKQIYLLFLEDLKEALQYLKDTSDIEVLSFNKTEADDIAAYIVCKHHSKFNHVWLLSTDEDWDLLLKENVSRFAYTSRKEFSLDNWDEHYDYTFDKHLSIKCLVAGEDNIKGVAGVGAKRATALLDTYGDVFNIIDAIPINSKLKYVATLNTSKELLLRNIELMDLVSYHECALGKESLIEIDNTIRKLLDG